MHLSRVAALAGALFAGGIAYSPGRPEGLDTVPLYLPSGLAAGQDAWNWHAPTEGGTLQQMGYSANTAGPGPASASATVELRAAGVAICTITLPCDGAVGFHHHSDCPVDVSGGVAISAHVLSTACTGGAVPSGMLTPRFRWR